MSDTPRWMERWYRERWKWLWFGYGPKAADIVGDGMCIIGYIINVM